MSFDMAELKAAVRRGPVARVVVAGTRGSVPRETGAAMLITATAQTGTIGGGALEFESADLARAALASGNDRVDHKPLGPALGQCCGGAVTVLTEIWDEARLAEFDGDVIARPLPGAARAIPLSVKRLTKSARATGILPPCGVTEGWMIEPVTRAARTIWIWGAGHVGRAIVDVLAPLPDVDISWADTGENRFPADVADNVRKLIAQNPADLVSLAPAHAEHLVLTYSHALDLELCHRILGRPFASLGLIGSMTKRTRFRKRLASLGHGPERINQIECPIGDPELGKHPHAIAVSVANAVLTRKRTETVAMGETG